MVTLCDRQITELAWHVSCEPLRSDAVFFLWSVECTCAPGRLSMIDVIYGLAILGFFVVTAGYAYACGRL